MSVIGIDFGNENCFIAVARAGGIETLANEYSQRVTPAYVAFGEKSRDLGVSAKNKQVTNIQNTVYGFKRLVGRKRTDPWVEDEVSKLPFTVCQMPDGGVGVKVAYLGEKQEFSCQQITAMLFTKLKEIGESALKIIVNDCVISVPAYFGDAERRAMLDSAQIAGLNVLRLMNEPTAVALAYGFYKTDLSDEKARNVVFVDMGQSALQLTVCAFNRGKMKILATVSDSSVGGREMDWAMSKHFAEDFKTRYKLDVPKNKRAVIRLLTECEKLRKQMSANTNLLPLNIECFMEDKDVSGSMNRDTLEELCSSMFKRIESSMLQLLSEAKLKLDDIEAVELVGGATRTPAIKKLVQKVFGKEPSTTLNLDEAVARGCALQCAMLSPAFKVRDFEISDVQPYPINLHWGGGKGEAGEMEVFPRFHKIPFFKKLTFMRTEPFCLEAKYAPNSNIPFSDSDIGSFLVQNVTPNKDGESSKVEVKVNINIHGVFSVSSASMSEKQESPPAGEPMDIQQDGQNESKSSPPNGDCHQEGSPEETMLTDQQNNVGEQLSNNNSAEPKENEKSQPTQKKPKKVTKTIQLPIDAKLPQLTEKALNDYVQAEANMIQQDRMEKERADAKNAVEEYVYDMRGQINEKLSKFISEKDREVFLQLLDDTENWLYDEGEDQTKSVYSEKLSELKKLGQPVVDRLREFDERLVAVEDLGRSMQQVWKAINSYQAKEEQYVHIASEEMEKVRKCVEEKEQWLDKQLGALTVCPPHENAPVLASQIRREKELLESTVRPILTQPRPKVEPPPQPEGSENMEETKAAPAAPSKESTTEETMETD